MATSQRPTPRHGGSHFSTGPSESRPRAAQARTHAAPSEGQTRHAGAARPAPRAQDQRASAAEPRLDVVSSDVLSSSRVSSRTAAATRRAQGHNVRRDQNPRRMSRVVFIAAGIVVVFVAVLLAVVVVPHLTGTDGSDGQTQEITPGQEVTVTIPDGSGASAIAQALYDNGVIASTSDFLAAARRTQTEANLKSGTYLFVTGADTQEILDLLTSGPNAMEGALTIPEGYTLTQIAQAVEETLGIPAADFTAQAKASNYVADYPFLADVENDSLEGYLFPKTYSFTDENVTADTVIRAMLSQYEVETADIDFDAAIASIQSRYGITVTEDDIITMASIVEREALTDDQRGHIASVFYNRLAQGMQLQSDATLTYSLGREATPDELQSSDDPYNTYTNGGLTPTPVCSPSLASIEAAVSPDDTNDLYFFIQSDYAVFSETYEQHQDAIANRPQ